MGKERGGEKTRESEREGRAAILHKGVNHPIFTAPSRSPQNGYFVPSCSQRHGGGGGGQGWRGGRGYEDASVSSRTSVACSSTAAQPFLIFIYTSAVWLLSATAIFLFFFFFFFTK